MTPDESESYDYPEREPPMSNPYRTGIHSEDEDRIRDLFLGKSVTKVADDQLLLSDGTRVRLVGNDGGCACSAGCYDLTELNECENIISNVEVDREAVTSGYEPDERYRLFVLAENRKINLATFDGTDGNGYYGTGFWIEVLAD